MEEAFISFMFCFVLTSGLCTPEKTESDAFTRPAKLINIIHFSLLSSTVCVALIPAKSVACGKDQCCNETQGYCLQAISVSLHHPVQQSPM